MITKDYGFANAERQSKRNKINVQQLSFRCIRRTNNENRVELSGRC